MSDDLVKLLRWKASEYSERTINASDTVIFLARAADRIQQLEAENARLREALKPFARQNTREMQSLMECDLDHEDFDRARAALKGTAHD